MLRLTLFGGLRLEDSDGPVVGRAAQRLRLALLALLASPPGEPVPRDRLTAYLWPDKNDARARSSLSTAIYDLRREFGEEAIRTHGDDISLDPAIIGSDVAEFTDALAAGDMDAAIACYAGPFLDGFFLSEARDFEGWVDVERQRYEREYRQALEELAERRAAAGDPQGAAEAWRQIAVLDPYASRTALRYMRALEAAGERATALRFARVHAALLEQEFGTEPDPEVTALEERLRREPARVAPVPDPDSGSDSEAYSESGSDSDLESESGLDAEPDSADPPSPDPVEVRPSPAPVEPRRRWLPGRRAVAGVAAATLILMVLALALMPRGQGADASLAVAEPLIGVAVLPFANLTGDPGEGHIAAGLTEDILNALAGIDRFRVPGVTSIAALQGLNLDLPAVGQRLGVEYAVAGSVRGEGDSLRVTASLQSTRTGEQLWNETYGGSRGSVFETQEEIARAVVRELAPQLGVPTDPLVPVYTRDEVAQELYWAGRALWNSRTADGLVRALDYFQQAVSRDDGYALAYAAIANVYSIMGAYDYAMRPPAEVAPLARESAERALALDPSLPQAHAALANVLFNFDWDWERAESEYERAIELDPGYFEARHWYSLLLLTAGRHDEALAQVRAARDLNPGAPVISTSLARHYYFRRDFERSLQAHEAILAMDPSFALAHLGHGLVLSALGEHQAAVETYDRLAELIGEPGPRFLALRGHALGRAGRTEEATAILHRLEQDATERYVPAHYLMLVHLGLGNEEEAMALFDEAYRQGSTAVLYARVDPLVDSVRDHPTFRRIMREVGPEPF